MHPTRRLLIGTVFLGALGALGACSSIGKHVFTPPVVTFRGASVRGIGFTGSALDLYLGVQNPNPYGLKAVGADYHVFVRDSVEVGSGAMRDTVTVGGHDSTIVKLPLDVRWAGLGSAGLQALMSGLVEYHITGDVVASTPFGNHTIPLNVRGRVRSDGTPVTTGAQP
jgi:LEA14-like dessication related protein